MFLASVFFCVAGSLVKYGSYIGAYRLAFFRFAIGLGLIATAVMSGRVKLVFNNKRLLFLRGLAGGIAVFISVLAASIVREYAYVILGTVTGFACIIPAIIAQRHYRKQEKENA